MLAVNNLCSALRQRSNVSDVAVLLEDSNELMQAESNNLDILLLDLDASEYSVVHAAVYYYKLMNISSDLSNEFGDLLGKIRQFIDLCSKIQIRIHYKYYVSMVHEICRKAASFDDRRGSLTVLVVRDALVKFQKDAQELTAIHNSLAQLCLFTKCFDEVLSVLDHDVSEVHKSVDANCFESYYYFGAMIYLSQKQLGRAQLFLELCLFNPSGQINSCIKEAFKKLSLVSILANDCLGGENSATWRSTDKPLINPRTDRQLKELHKSTYVEFLNHYNAPPTSYSSSGSSTISINRSLARCREFAESQRSIFERDGNWGLVKQCLCKYREREIIRMTKMYVSLMLDDLTSYVALDNSEQTQSLVFSMIGRGLINAKIHAKKALVEFNCGSSPSNILAKLHDEMESCIQLQNKLKAINQAMSLDPLYLKKVLEKELTMLK